MRAYWTKSCFASASDIDSRSAFSCCWPSGDNADRDIGDGTAGAGGIAGWAAVRGGNAGWTRGGGNAGCWAASDGNGNWPLHDPAAWGTNGGNVCDMPGWRAHDDDAMGIGIAIAPAAAWGGTPDGLSARARFAGL